MTTPPGSSQSLLYDTSSSKNRACGSDQGRSVITVWAITRVFGSTEFITEEKTSQP